MSLHGAQKKGKFCNTISSVAILVHTSNQSDSKLDLGKSISECRQKKFSQPVIQNKHSRKVALKLVRQSLCSAVTMGARAKT